MGIAAFTIKNRRLRNLNLSLTTLYDLTDYEDDADLPSIIEELAKHAKGTKSLKPGDASRVIKIGIARRRFGEHPDARLLAMMQLDESRPWHEEVVAALRKRQPDTDESASSIIDEVIAAHKPDDAIYGPDGADDEVTEDADETEDYCNEAEDILDGPPPALPPPTSPPEPQKFGADTEWEGRDTFVNAVMLLVNLCTKSAERFANSRISPIQLQQVSDFLARVAACSAQNDIAA